MQPAVVQLSVLQGAAALRHTDRAAHDVTLIFILLLLSHRQTAASQVLTCSSCWNNKTLPTCESVMLSSIRGTEERESNCPEAELSPAESGSLTDAETNIQNTFGESVSHLLLLRATNCQQMNFLINVNCAQL